MPTKGDDLEKKTATETNLETIGRNLSITRYQMKLRVVANFLRHDNGSVIMEVNIIILRRQILKYMDMKCFNYCNSFFTYTKNTEANRGRC